MENIRIEKHICEMGFRGCVSVRRGGESLFCGAYGLADWANGVPNALQTRFATASAGKVFVAAGILQLIERGSLRFTDTLSTVLPMNWRAIDPGITVEQLLTHTSGIPDYFDESVMNEYEDLWRDYPNYKIRSNDDLLPLFIDKPMMYPRGARFQYNNTGFVVLALMIEAAAGQPFDRYLQANVFDVCHMGSTGYYELDRLPARCANSYISDGERGGYRTNIYSVDAKGTGAGGAFTTAGDVERFWDALLSEKLLAAETVKDMLARHSGNGEDHYGYGIWLRPEGEAEYSPFFQGSDPGVSFISQHRLYDGLSITLMSNYGDNVWELLEVLRAAFPQAHKERL